MNWTSDDFIAILAAPVALMATLRIVRALAPRVPEWTTAYIAALWALVLSVLVVLLVFAVTVKAVLVAWIFAALGAWNLTRIWLVARRSVPPES